MEKKYDSLETMHGTFQTTFNKMHLSRKPWTPENPNHVKNVIPGTVVEINVKEGQQVAEGEELIIFKAMKMHNRILAPRACTIKKICVSAGENISSHTVMLELE